jgi:hypothetical protein
MQKRAQKNEEKRASDSEAKRSGRYLRLTYRGDPAYLERIEFRFNSNCIKSYVQRGDENRPLNWRSVEWGISLCFLGYLDWQLTKKSGRFFFGSENAVAHLAKQLSGAIYQTKHGMHDLFFGMNPENLETCVTHLVFPTVPGINKSGRSKFKPLMIAIDEHFLPPDCLQILWDRQSSGDSKLLLDVSDIQDLYGRIRKHLALSIGEQRRINPSVLDLQSLQAPTTNITRRPNRGKAPHNLPQAPEHFFGHDKLRKETVKRLAKRGLSVIQETGGIGKTTFAKSIAYEAVRQKLLPGGAVWINCETAPTLDGCIRTCLSVVFGHTGNDWSQSECERRLQDHLARSHTLLVFDNFETVINQEAFNVFLRAYRDRCCLLITTRNPYGEMQDQVQLSELDPRSAVEMFVCETGSPKPDSGGMKVVQDLCEFVGHLPLAILLLARQARTCTLAQLKTELKMEISQLVSNDGFLNERHRSIIACFRISFDRLSPEDQDTLFRLSVVPVGLGKSFAKDYLGKPTWLASLTQCLNSGLLRLADGKYKFHPMVQRFLHEQMRDRKSEWEGHFVDFFCTLLDETFDRGEVPNLNVDEQENYLFALETAARQEDARYCLLLLEMTRTTVSDTRYLRYFDELTSRHKKLLSSALREAQAENNTKRVIRILMLLFRAGSERQERGCLAKIARIDRFVGTSLQLDLEARRHFQDGNWLMAEILLRKSLSSWELAGSAFRGYRDAALINLLTVLCRHGKSDDAKSVAERLWTACSNELTYLRGRCSSAHEYEWAVPKARSDVFGRTFSLYSHCRRRRKRSVSGTLRIRVRPFLSVHFVSSMNWHWPFFNQPQRSFCFHGR